MNELGQLLETEKNLITAQRDKKEPDVLKNKMFLFYFILMRGQHVKLIADK